MDNVLVIPRRALRSENTVWTVGQDNVLRIKAVDVLDVRGDQLTVRLSTGWPGGPLRLIVSALNVAVDGMPVMPEQEGVSVDKPVESS